MTEDFLESCFWQLKRDKAVGVDGVTVGEYEVSLAENLSIAQIAKIALKATKSSNLELVFDESSPDGQYRKDLCNDRLFNIIGSFRFTSLSEGNKKNV